MTESLDITTVAPGTWIDALAWNELLADPQPEIPLCWFTSINGDASEWEDLQGIGHLVELIEGLPGVGDFMVVQDDDPETRYVQTMRLENGHYTVEIAMLLANGALNLRVGRGVAAGSEPNGPELGATELQRLSMAETIEVMTCWAAGTGLPAGYAGAIYAYMH